MKTRCVGWHGKILFILLFLFLFSRSTHHPSYTLIILYAIGVSPTIKKKPKFLFRPYGNRFKVLPSVFLQNGNELTPYQCRNFQGLALKMSSADIGVYSFLSHGEIDILVFKNHLLFLCTIHWFSIGNCRNKKPGTIQYMNQYRDMENERKGVI